MQRDFLYLRKYAVLPLKTGTFKLFKDYIYARDEGFVTVGDNNLLIIG